MSQPSMTMSRDIAAPRPLVYAAWTEAEHLQHWFVPQGFSTVLCEVDARVGGSFRVHWADKSGTIYPNKGEYLELTPHDRIVYVDTFDDDREDNQPTRVTIELADFGGKTRLTSTSHFASKQYMEKLLAMGMEQGWIMFMDQMVAYAESIQNPT